MADADRDRDLALREALDGLDLPPHSIRQWLEDGKAFCNAHGGTRHYEELLALYDRCLALLDAPERAR